MASRLKNPHALAPQAIKLMRAVEQALAEGGLDPILMDLVRLRASQINGCAYCIHMHATHLTAAGESAIRLAMLPAWRESSLYSDRERAALGWTEALTLLPQNHASDADYAMIEAQFSEEEQVHLTLLIGSINNWNRLQVGFRVAHPVESPHAAA